MRSSSISARIPEEIQAKRAETIQRSQRCFPTIIAWANAHYNRNSDQDGNLGRRSKLGNWVKSDDRKSLKNIVGIVGSLYSLPATGGTAGSYYYKIG